MQQPTVLLVIGIHREELAFGCAVAERIDAGKVAVLAISEGLSNRLPSLDERYRHDMLLRRLYLQLLPHMVGRHRLLIDLHTGIDPAGPSVDLISCDAPLRDRLAQCIGERPDLAEKLIRVLPLGPNQSIPHVRTMIPQEVWNNPAFVYLGMEIYQPPGERADQGALDLALVLIQKATDCVATELGQERGAPVAGHLSAANGGDARPNVFQGSLRKRRP